MSRSAGPVAMLLAAGFGTRLRPLTELLPKPLVMLGDRAVAAHISERLAAAGYSRLVANVHHLPERWDAAALSALALPTEVVRETRILGTAGGVANARAQLGPGELLVHGGDILVDLDLERLRAVHRDRGALATLALVGGKPVGEGTVGLGADGAVVRLRDGRYGIEREGADFVGVQLLSPAARERLPDEGCLVGDVYMPALASGARVIGLAVARDFSDIGSLGEYLEANLAWLRRRAAPAYVAPDAQVGPGIRLVDSLVGAAARVEGHGVLQRCVVWPNALARAPLSDAIVTPEHVVPVR